MKKRTKERNEAAEEVVSYVKQHKKTTMLYVILRILVVVVMVAEIFNRNWNNVFMCILTLVLFMVPVFVDKRLHITLPNTLEVIILLFIFAAEILGEINEYYLHYPGWDDMLHTMNGFLMAAIGFSLIDILNQNEKISFKLSPAFVALVAFCFSMTVGVVWEFYEFGMDYFTYSDMQKDTVLTSISSVMFNPEGRNVAVTIPIESVVINGQPWDFGGYIDIGLYDTMSDLFVNFIGAVVFSVIGLFYIKGRGKGSFAKRFIPKMKTQVEIQQDQAMEKARRDKFAQSVEQEFEHMAENSDMMARMERIEADREELKRNGEKQKEQRSGDFKEAREQEQNQKQSQKQKKNQKQEEHRKQKD